MKKSKSKLTKKDIDKAKKSIEKIRSEQKAREEKYKGKIEDYKEKKEGYIESIKTKLNTLKQLEKNKRRLPADINLGIKKRFEYRAKGEKLEREKKYLQRAKLKQTAKQVGTKALILGSKVEAGVNVALESGMRKLGQLAKAKVTSKKILKKSKTSYKIPDRQVENVWNDENKFFRGAVSNGML